MNTTKVPFELTRKCVHYPYGNMPEWSCVYCISNWCKVNTLDKIQEVINIFKQEGLIIASQRMEMELKSRKMYEREKNV